MFPTETVEAASPETVFTTWLSRVCVSVKLNGAVPPCHLKATSCGKDEVSTIASRSVALSTAAQRASRSSAKKAVWPTRTTETSVAPFAGATSASSAEAPEAETVRTRLLPLIATVPTAPDAQITVAAEA